MAKRNKMTKGQTIIYKTLYRKLKIERHESDEKLRMDSVASVPVPIVAPVVLLLLKTL
jgi:hypothetical protein